MKALMKYEKGYGNMELRDIDEPINDDDQIKIKVKYSGICGSDIHAYKGKYKNSVLPVVLGHEFSGTVVDIGKNVKNVKIGDKVTSETTFYICGKCNYCKEKHYNLCPNRKGLGTQQNGSFAEYVIARKESVHVLPEKVDLLSASLTEPLACATHAVMEKTSIKEGEKVLVFGPGPIGNLVSQVAKANGAYVILAGIDKDTDRLQFAKKFGIDRTVNIQKEDLKKVINELTDGYGVDKVFECSGAVPAVNSGLELIKKRGTLVQIGIFVKSKNEIDQGKIVQKEIQYVGSRSQKPSSWDKALKLLDNKKVDAKSLITDIYELDNWDKAFDKVMSGESMKVVIES